MGKTPYKNAIQDLSTALRFRYATKKFDSTKKLSTEQINGIKELLRLSASSVNSQPWHFIIASSDSAKARIAKSTQGGYSFNEHKILEASHVVVFCSKLSIDDDYMMKLLNTEEKDGIYKESSRGKEEMHGARKFFIGLHSSDDLLHWIQKQVYLNVGTLLLGAAHLGIDAVPIEGFDAKTLDDEFSLKSKGYSSTVIVPLGFRSTEDRNQHKPKSRLPVTELFTEL